VIFLAENFFSGGGEGIIPSLPLETPSNPAISTVVLVKSSFDFVVV